MGRATSRRLVAASIDHHVVTDAAPPCSLIIAALAREGGRLTWTRRYARSSGHGTEMGTTVEYVLPRGFASAALGSPAFGREIESEVIRSVENFSALVEAATGSRV